MAHVRVGVLSKCRLHLALHLSSRQRPFCGMINIYGSYCHKGLVEPLPPLSGGKVPSNVPNKDFIYSLQAGRASCITCARADEGPEWKAHCPGSRGQPKTRAYELQPDAVLDQAPRAH